MQCAEVVIGGESDQNSSCQQDTCSQQSITPSYSDLAVQCKIETLGKFSIEHFRSNSRMIYYYTGFNSFEHFNLFFNILGPAVNELNYKCSLLIPEDQLFLTLMKLKQAKEDIELSFLFGISESTVSKIIVTWINFMYYQLKELKDQFWPTMDIINEHMPDDFRTKFQTTRVILDATETPIQKPSDVEAQSTTWSSYKHMNTL